MIKERLVTLAAGDSSAEARIAALLQLQDLVAPLDNANDLKARENTYCRRVGQYSASHTLRLHFPSLSPETLEFEHSYLATLWRVQSSTSSQVHIVDINSYTTTT